MRDLRAAGVEIVNIGQYLQPTAQQQSVVRYWHPDEFAELRKAARAMGFMHCEAGPFVRSSYHAGDQFRSWRRGSGMSSDSTIAAAIAARAAAYAPYSGFTSALRCGARAGPSTTVAMWRTPPIRRCLRGGRGNRGYGHGRRATHHRDRGGRRRRPTVHPVRRLPPENPGIRRRHGPHPGVRPRRAAPALHLGRPAARIIRPG